jgi:hypothetical protein
MAALRTALALEQSCPAQRNQELIEKMFRHRLPFGNRGTGHRTLAIVGCQINHGAQPVVAFHRYSHDNIPSTLHTAI